jgi:hypothetical protein
MPRLLNVQMHLLAAASRCGPHSSWCRMRSSVHCGERTRVERDRCGSQQDRFLMSVSLWFGARDETQKPHERRLNVLAAVALRDIIFVVVVKSKVNFALYILRRHGRKSTVLFIFNVGTIKVMDHLHAPATLPPPPQGRVNRRLGERAASRDVSERTSHPCTQSNPGSSSL